MLAAHMCSGRPVVADCIRQNSCGVCVPLPKGSLAFRYKSPALAAISISRLIGISRNTSRARSMWRLSILSIPPLAWCTCASTSPVSKCTTSCFSRLSYGLPKRITGISSTFCSWQSVNAHGGRLGEFMERPRAADSIPWVLLERQLAFAFVPFHEAGNEGFFRQRRELDATCFSIADKLIVVVEFNDLDGGSRLRRVVRDFVVVGRIERLSAGQPHQGVAVGRRHVDAVE